jgi:hypothetical protein
MIHIGARWEYQTWYTYEQDENIRHDTHRSKMRISDMIHIDILILFLCVSCLIFSSCSYVYYVWYSHLVPMCIMSDILILFLCVSCLIFSYCSYVYHVWYSYLVHMCIMSRNKMRISDIIHIGTRWEYQTWYTYEQEGNIRQNTHMNKMRISDIIHIGTRWEYQTWYT